MEPEKNLSEQEKRITDLVLEAAAKSGVGPWDNCIVGQAGRQWPLAVLIEMNLKRMRKGFDPLPIRSEDGDEFYAPWSYGVLGVTNENELITLFESLAAKAELAREDMEDELPLEFWEDDEQEYLQAESEGDEGDEEVFEDSDEDIIMLEPVNIEDLLAEPDVSDLEPGGEPLTTDFFNEIVSRAKRELPKRPVEQLSDRELAALAKADAEIDRFNMVLGNQLEWLRSYPDQEQRIDFYKTLRDFMGEIADRLDDLY